MTQSDTLFASGPAPALGALSGSSMVAAGETFFGPIKPDNIVEDKLSDGRRGFLPHRQWCSHCRSHLTIKWLSVVLLLASTVTTCFLLRGKSGCRDGVNEVGTARVYRTHFLPSTSLLLSGRYALTEGVTSCTLKR